MLLRGLLGLACIFAVLPAAFLPVSSDRAQAGERQPDDVVRELWAAVESGNGPAAAALVTDGFSLYETGRDGFGIFGKPALAAVITQFVGTNHTNIDVSNVHVDGNTVTGEVQWRDDDTRAAGVARYVEHFTIDVTDDLLVSNVQMAYDLDDAQTVQYLDFLDSQEDDEGPPGNFIEIALAEQSGSGQPGGAFIFEMAPGVTGLGVFVDSPPEGVQQPAHLHTGTCASPGPIVYPLANVYNGGGFSFISADYQSVIGQGLILNVHKSVAEPGVYVACGLVAGESTTPPPAPSPTQPTGVRAPDTGTGDAAEGSGGSALAAVLLALVGVAAAGSGALRMRRR